MAMHCAAVRLLRHFTFRGHLCLVFEMLASTLYEHLSARAFVGLPLAVVREYARQILQALDFLTLDGVCMHAQAHARRALPGFFTL
jgi:hypothetical protein